VNGQLKSHHHLFGEEFELSVGLLLVFDLHDDGIDGRHD